MLLSVAGAHALAAPPLVVDPNSEPFPISVDVQPSTTVVNSSIQVSGTTLPALNQDVMVTISAPEATPPQTVKMPAVRSADGSFKVSYIPTVAGAYTVDALAPDGHGHASASFTVENPRALSPGVASSPRDVAQDGRDMVQIVREKVLTLPYSPARDEMVKKLDTALTQLGQFIQDVNDIEPDLTQLLADTADLPPIQQTPPKQPPDGTHDPGPGGNTDPGPSDGGARGLGPLGHSTPGDNNVASDGGATGLGPLGHSTPADNNVASDGGATGLGPLGHSTPADKKVVNDRDKLVASLATAAEIHKRTKQQEEAMKQSQVICDNLEVVVDALKWVSTMMNFITGNVMSGVTNFAQDLLAAKAGDAISGLGGFAAGEAVKNVDGVGFPQVYKRFNNARVGGYIKKVRTVEVEKSNFVGIGNDILGVIAGGVMAHYCEQFSGPVTAHMHAIFKREGRKWWEYSFDVQGQLIMHYPKDSSGASVPLKGRIEGFASNYTLWENALSVLFPNLMSSAVQKRGYILPMALGNTHNGSNLHGLNDSEGSVFGTLVTPASFKLTVTGTATKDKLDIHIGPSVVDTDAKARVIAYYLSVFPIQAGMTVYLLPYKPVHFVFEKGAPTYTLDLTTSGDVVKGKGHWTNEKGNDQAWGEYTVDIQACNPGC